ncbi:hypothetical protein WMY93_025726 [Mugilogobius chulae]|uniref:Bcl-2-like protein 13 n=1 Tax=Mugilogobius chulae TaxID=88201 RepID=A0AAW0N171_9GOBI
MEDADTEDTQSLGSSGSGTQAADENHSSSAETDLLGQGEEPKSAWMFEEQMTSGLSEFSDEGNEDIQAPQTVELQVLVEEPHIEKEPAEFMQVVPPMALPPLPILQLEPPSNIFTPVLCTGARGPEKLLTPQGLYPPSNLTPMSPSIEKTAEKNLRDSQEHSVQASSSSPTQKEQLKSKPAKTQTFTEVPVLLCGGAALVAVVGVLAYGAMALLKK